MTIDNISRSYATLLRAYLRQDKRSDLGAALRLGHRALATGIGLLGLARIHERILATEDPKSRRPGSDKQAERFFNEAAIPIEESHHGAQRVQAELVQMRRLSVKQTAELESAKLQIGQGLVRHVLLEGRIKEGASLHSRLLTDSLRLQEDFRTLTRQVLEAQESERKAISGGLYDHISQTLLGINVRLVALKKEAKANTTGLKTEISRTQRLMAKSARSVRRVARALGNA